VLTARTPAGESVAIALEPGDLVVAVKAHCDGCASMLHGNLAALGNRRVILLARDVLEEPTTQPYFVCPDGMLALELYSAPHYVVVDGTPLAVVAEGPVFSPDQVAADLR
jgi:hypothetical protein